MAKQKSRKSGNAQKTHTLSKKTRQVYEDVVRTDQGESVLEALQRAEELATNVGSVEELRDALSIETSHPKEVIGAQAHPPETGRS